MFPNNIDILVVDDLNATRQVVVMLLKNMGFENVHQATDGVHALERMEKLAATMNIRMGLILLDINMPNMDGIQVLKAVRADPRTANIPVVMLTAENEKSTVISALKEGANGYILKPPTADVLKAKLEELSKKFVK